MKIIPDYGDVSKPEVRAKYRYLEGFVSIAGNAGLFVIKLMLDIMINSICCDYKQALLEVPHYT